MRAVAPPFSLRAGSVVLRPFTRRHLESPQYLRWMNDQEITRTIGRFDYLFPVSRAKLRRYFADIDTETTLFLAITAPTVRGGGGRFVGTLKIYDLDYLARRASLGILVGERAAWGRGIASAAIEAATRYVFDELGFQKITAGYLATNAGMARAFEKNGFRVEGVLEKQLFAAGRLVDHVMVCKFRSTGK
jgi:[ribosomal protein S5]-alanine N-acetyltransferase